MANVYKTEAAPKKHKERSVACPKLAVVQRESLSPDREQKDLRMLFDFNKQLKELDTNLKRKREGASVLLAKGPLHFSIIGGLSVPQNYPVLRSELSVSSSQPKLDTRKFSNGVAAVPLKKYSDAGSERSLKKSISGNFRASSEISKILDHRQLDNESCTSSGSHSPNRLLYRNLYKQRQDQDEQFSENRKLQRYVVKHNLERDQRIKRDIIEDKSEALRLNRNNYQKYIGHLNRGCAFY